MSGYGVIKEISENIGFLNARMHEYDDKRNFFIQSALGEIISECIYSLK